MSDDRSNGVHWSFWVIGAVALIWNGLGVANFFAQMDPDVLDAYRASEQTIVQQRPVWATIGFALAVFGGALGSLMLLLKRSSAIHLFIISLIGVIMTMLHALTSGVEFGAGEVIGIIAMPIAVAVFLIWYAKWTQNKGWTR